MFLRRLLCLSFLFIKSRRAATIKPKKGQKRKHQKKLERWRTLLVLVSCLVPWIVSHEKRKKVKTPKNPDLPHSFSSCLLLLDGRTPTPGGRPTYTLSTQNLPKKPKKKKRRKKKLKRIKYLGVLLYLLSFFFSMFSVLSAWLIFAESIGRTSSGRAITGINHKNRCVMARKVTSVEVPLFLSLFPTSFSLLSAQLISTGSHGRTSSGRATTEINQKN
jgi:hypothetical protein